jgi:deoxycytidylate deaminase
LFHTLPPYYVLAQKRVEYKLCSPFANETEAREYESSVMPSIAEPHGTFTAKEMLGLAGQVAKRSFDYGFQTGVALGRKKGASYDFLAQTFNKVVPYQGYAMHVGASREVNFSPMHDLNHYDTVHAEVELIITAQKQKIDLTGTTLFINLLPCPSCARMFAETDITEFVYVNDHSEGYGLRMLEAAGKKVRRLTEAV